MKLKYVAAPPKPLHRAGFLLSPSRTGQVLPSRSALGTTCQCSSWSTLTFPWGDKNQTAIPGQFAAHHCFYLLCLGRADSMKWTLPVSSASEDRELLLSKEESARHPLLLFPKTAAALWEERGELFSGQTKLWPVKRGVPNSSSDPCGCRCWTSPCQLKKWHNFLLQKSPKVKKKGKSNIG